MNQKGGVGKTTTCANLGAALAELGRNVCLIDLDPQAHLTINFGIDSGDEQLLTVYDLLMGEGTFLEAVRRLEKFPQSPGNVAVLPGSIDLAAAESQLGTQAGRHTILRDAIGRATHDFDYFLLDCPPSLGLLTLNGLSLADEVLIPMQAHFLALQGFAKLLETVQLVRQQLNPRLRVAGVALTMFESQTRLSGEVVGELQQFLDSARGSDLPWATAKLFDTRIRRNIKLAESPSFGEPITVYDSASNGAADYRALAKELDAATPADAHTEPRP
jgi:chromosome partitioning protein